MSPTEQVSNLINCLTKDEDLRQDLWVHYLSGHSPSSFASYLQKIEKEFAVDTELQERLWYAFNAPVSVKFNELLECFSDVERSVLCMLSLGLTVSQISGYKRISEIRIRQVISIVKENECWEELYGVKETTNRARAIRVK